MNPETCNLRDVSQSGYYWLWAYDYDGSLAEPAELVYITLEDETVTFLQAGEVYTCTDILSTYPTLLIQPAAPPTPDANLYASQS